MTTKKPTGGGSGKSQGGRSDRQQEKSNPRGPSTGGSQKRDDGKFGNKGGKPKPRPSTGDLGPNK